MKPAIVLSGNTVGLGVTRALATMGVPVVMIHFDEPDIAHVSRYVTTAIRAPHPEHHEAQFVDLLVTHADRFGAGLLIPACDDALAVTSRHKDLLRKHYVVACPEWEITRRFIDKKHTYALAERHGVPAPKTVVPNSLAGVTGYAEAIGYPLLVKPCQSHLFYDHFRRKMFRIDDPDQLITVYRRAANANLEVMLQEIIPGDDSHVVNYNAYAWEGKSLVEFTAEHVRNAPPFFGSPRVALSTDTPEVLEPGRRILRALGFYGYACTEFKKDPRDGVFKLMEVNGRHNLSTLLAVHCGINFPWLQYTHLMHGQCPEPTSYRKGVYWIDITRDIGYSVQYRAQEKYSLSQYLRPYVSPHIFAIYNSRDLTPIIRRLSFLFRKAVRSHLRFKRRPNKHHHAAPAVS